MSKFSAINWSYTLLSGGSFLCRLRCTRRFSCFANTFWHISHGNDSRSFSAISSCCFLCFSNSVSVQNNRLHSLHLKNSSSIFIAVWNAHKRSHTLTWTFPVPNGVLRAVWFDTDKTIFVRSIWDIPEDLNVRLSNVRVHHPVIQIHSHIRHRSYRKNAYSHWKACDNLYSFASFASCFYVLPVFAVV